MLLGFTRRRVSLLQCAIKRVPLCAVKPRFVSSAPPRTEKDEQEQKNIDEQEQKNIDEQEQKNVDEQEQKSIDEQEAVFGEGNAKKDTLVLGQRVPIPTPGKSSGDSDVDRATSKWRLTNTPDDERLAHLFKKESDKKLKKQQLVSLMPSHKDMIKLSNSRSEDEEPPADDGDITARISEDEQEKYVSPKNDETGEFGGPTGKEPTRYGDWERKGLCIDF